MQIEEAPGGSSLMRRLVQWSLVALLGLGAGVVTMASTVPVGFAVRMAGVAVPADVRLTGTVWNGAADFAQGHRAVWDSRAWDSAIAIAWIADLHVTGPETDLAGQWALRPGDATLARLRGGMGWSLVEAVMPGLEITCATSAEVDLVSVRVAADGRAAAGLVRLAAGTCARVDGTVGDVPLPALLARIATTADGVGIDITAVDAPDVPLGNLVVTPDDRLRVTVFAAGAAMVPGLPGSGDSQIELPLALFTQ
jgi:hypothetical protein